MKRSLVLVFANSAYEDVLQNWLAAISRIDVTNYLVIALDKPLKWKLKKQGVPVKYHRCGSEHSALWALRVRIVRKYLKRGWDVIHSDADAVWLENPLPCLAAQGEDLVFTQGIDWPNDVHEQWGFVLCCGLFMIRSNRRTKNFMRSWQKRVKQDGDDQVSCNRLLLESGLKWKLPTEYYELEYKGKALRCYRQPVSGGNGELTSALLPHGWAQRVDDDTSMPTVMHPISEKEATCVQDALKERRCWFL